MCDYVVGFDVRRALLTHVENYIVDWQIGSPRSWSSFVRARVSAPHEARVSFSRVSLE